IVVGICCLEQPAAVPDWMVRRITPDADPDHPHHPHRKNPVFAEPREQLADPNDDPRGRRGGGPTLFPTGAHTRFRAIAGKLLGGRVCNYPRVLRAGAFGQELVRAALGGLRQRAPRAHLLALISGRSDSSPRRPRRAKEKRRRPSRWIKWADRRLLEFSAITNPWRNRRERRSHSVGFRVSSFWYVLSLRSIPDFARE